MHPLKLILSRNIRFILIKRKAVLAFTILALLTLINCGKRKPPLPPVEKVQQRAEISGFQRGNKIILSWKLPNRNASDSSLLNIDRADIYRLVEKSDSPYPLSEDEFIARSIIISSVKFDRDDFFNTKTFSDTLEFAGQPIRLRYAIRFVNKSGQKAAFSNFLVFEATKTVAASPKNLTGSVTQDSIDLKWIEPEFNIDDSKSLNILGYNVYRSEDEKTTAKLLTKNPITKNEFNDEFFEFGKTYFYFVRAVSLGKNSEPIESDESNIIKVSPIDNFVPAPPSSITIAASPGSISIFFAVNPEKDVIGYRIYRTTDADLPLNRWAQINDGILSVNTFQDNKIESGIKYYYYLKAVDKAGNISEPSEIVSETAP